MNYKYTNKGVDSAYIQKILLTVMVWTTEIISDLLEFELKEKYKQTPFYGGNPSLRKARIRFECTQEEKVEYVRCMKDILYFAQNYCMIFDVRLQMYAPIVLTNDQITILTQNDKITTHDSSRQSGISHAYAILCLHRILFKLEYKIAFVDVTKRLCENGLDIIKSYYANMPFFLKQGIEVFNNNQMKFENNSSLKAYPVTNDIFRGFSPDLTIINNINHYSVEAAEMIWRITVPVTLARRDDRLIIQSSIDSTYDSVDRNDVTTQKRLAANYGITHKTFGKSSPLTIGMSALPMSCLHAECVKLIKNLMDIGNVTPRGLRQLTRKSPPNQLD